MGIVTTTSETTFTQSAQEVYDFVTNPGNWPKTYPTSRDVGGVVTHALPLKVGDVWTEKGPSGEVYTWHLAMAMPPRLWMFNSVGKLGHDEAGNGGLEGRITVQYHFTCPGQDVTLFTRTMTIEAYKDRPRPTSCSRSSTPRSSINIMRRFSASWRRAEAAVSRPAVARRSAPRRAAPPRYS